MLRAREGLEHFLGCLVAMPAHGFRVYAVYAAGAFRASRFRGARIRSLGGGGEHAWGFKCRAGDICSPINRKRLREGRLWGVFRASRFVLRLCKSQHFRPEHVCHRTRRQKLQRAPNYQHWILLGKCIVREKTKWRLVRPRPDRASVRAPSPKPTTPPEVLENPCRPKPALSLHPRPQKSRQIGSKPASKPTLKATKPKKSRLSSKTSALNFRTSQGTQNLSTLWDPH